MAKKNGSSEHEESDSEDVMDVDIGVTPKRRGRPPKNRDSLGKTQSPVKKPKVDEEEYQYNSEDEIDPVGEEKITKDGYLLGGREYRFQTFTLGNSTELYLFSLDASKLLGFRDSYIFFLRNTKVQRINASEADREYLQKMRILPSQLRSRPITLIKAKNLFKVFGHKVVRRGRPVRDDYICKDIEEPAFNEDSRAEEDEQSFGIYDHHKSSLAGGPFRRHGISILGYKNISIDDAYEPMNIFNLQDNWMQKCSDSCAEFNHRNRPLSFLDLHTNIEQIAKKTQPNRVRIQLKNDDEEQFKIDKEVAVGEVDSQEWVDIGTAATALTKTILLNGQRVPLFGHEEIVLGSEDDEIFPLAIMRDQHQSQFSLFPMRFGESDVPKQIPIRQEPFDLPPTLLGVQPFLPANALVSKRLRQKKMDNGYADTFEICVHCHEHEAPLDLQGFPSTLTLSCSKCQTKHHPRCIDFTDNALITKCMTYPWLCANCKLCEKCNKAGQDDKLLFCDVCDRGTHMFCLSPPLKELPTGVWVCEKCAVCESCGTNQSKWCHVVNNGDFICTYCKDCYHDFVNDRFCPFCLETFSKDDDVAMVCCDQCERWVHVECEPQLDDDKYERLVEQEDPEFVCTLCDEDSMKHFMDRKTDPYTKVLEYKGNTLVVPPVKKNKKSGF